MSEHYETVRLSLTHAVRLTGLNKEDEAAATSGGKCRKASRVLKVLWCRSRMRDMRVAVGRCALELQQKLDERQLKPLEGLLDFPGASGLSTPFFLFLRHLRLPSSAQSLPSSSYKIVSHPLLLSIHRTSGPLRPFAIVRCEELIEARAKHLLDRLQEHLGPELTNMPVSQFLADDGRKIELMAFLDKLYPSNYKDSSLGGHLFCLFEALGRLMNRLAPSVDTPFPRDSHDLPIFSKIPSSLLPTQTTTSASSMDLLSPVQAPSPEERQRSEPEAKSTVPTVSDEVTLASASYRALQMQPPRDSLSDGFARTVVFRSDEQFVVAQYLPLFPASSSPLAAARSADSSSATSPAAFDPSFSDFNFAATGAVTYLILVSPIERLPSPNMLWSHLASLGDPLPRQKSLISQLTDLPVFATLSSTLIDNKLSLSPPPEPTAEVEQQEETEEAKPNVVLSPSTRLQIHIHGSSSPHHQLLPLQLDEPASPSIALLDQQDVVLSSRTLGYSYKAVVFAAAQPGNRSNTLVLKYCKDRDLTEEAAVHAELNRITPDLAPKCYGIYSATGCMDGYRVLVTEHAGKEVTSFRDLKEEQRLEIRSLFTALHEAGFEHGSFGERNVVCDETGRFRLIDFERTTRHECEGVSSCFELDEVRHGLELPSEAAGE